MRTTVALKLGPTAEFTFEEVDLEPPREDEVLVRIAASGLCHTDLTVPTMLPQEMFPNVFGHEGAGVVEQVGTAVEGIAVGDHVVMSLRSCRACATCTAGEYGYCESSLVLNYMGLRMDGSTTYSREGQPVLGSFFGQSSFSRHAIAYADNTVVVDRSLDLARIAPYGCGFQAGAGAVLNVTRAGPGHSLAVYGIGAVGLAAVAAAVGAGVGTVVAVDTVPSRLERAARYGATVIDPSTLGDASLVDAVRAATGGGSSYAIDTTSVPDVLKQAGQALASRGELVVLGLGSPDLTLDAIDLLQGGKVVRGSVEGDSDPLEMIPRMLELNARGAFDVDDLVVTYPFEEINRAVEDVQAGKVVKPVLVWDS